MLKKKESVFKNLFILIDIIIAILSYIVAYKIREYYYDGLQYSDQYIYLGIIIIPVWYIFSRVFDINSFYRTKSYSEILLNCLLTITLSIGVLFFLISMLKFGVISRGVIMLFAITNTILLYINKIIIYKIFKYYRSKGYNTRNVLIFADSDSESCINEIINNPEWGYKLLGIITNSDSIKNIYGKQYQVFPDSINFENILSEKTIDEVIYCKNEFDSKSISSILYSCEEVGIVFNLKSQLLAVFSTKASLNYFGDTPFFVFKKTSTKIFALFVKAIFDFLFSLLVLIISSPLFFIISLFIKLDSSGPVIFKQTRVGLRGRHFTMYKFRTMVKDAEQLKGKLLENNEMDGPVFKIKEDPRLTRTGKFLRRTSLDEFPQFWNVLKGDMSVIGPRPPLQQEVDKYERWQKRRLSMKPGITCIWQVSGRNELSFEEWMRMDLEYIDSWSLKLDIILFFKTIKTMFKITGQ